MRAPIVLTFLVSSTFAACAGGGGQSPDAGADGSPDPQNGAPIANAGSDRVVGRGIRVTLDGRGSYDPDQDPLTYSWILATAPATSTAMLSDSASATPEIVLQVAGTYELSLVVHDGALPSAPDAVTITVNEGMPVADAGPDQDVVYGALVSLDGTDSFDMNGDALSYTWVLASAPPGSAASISNPASPAPSFTADLPGEYAIDLVVADAVFESAPDRVVITATNAAPVVSAGPDIVSEVGQTVLVVGSASDEEGAPLTFSWTVIEQPAGSTATPATPTQSTTEITLDMLGLYRLRLSASDGFVTADDEVEVRAGPEVVALTHDVVDAEYSRALDRIVLVSDDTGDLSILDPVTGNEVVVALPITPLSVSVAPNGLEAVVGHDGWMSVVNLSTGTLIQTWPSTAIGGDVVHGGNGYAYMIPSVDQWENLRCVAIASGIETLGTGSIRAGSRGRRHPTQSALYIADRGLSPSDIEKHSIASGTSNLLYDSPYHGDYAMCGDLWLSEDGLKIFTACGNIFVASTSSMVDMTYNGSLASTELIAHVDHSAAAELVAVMPANTFNQMDADTRVDLYEDSFLAFDQMISLPEVPIGTQWVQARGQFVFFDQDGAALYVIMKATPMAGLPQTMVWRAL